MLAPTTEHTSTSINAPLLGYVTLSASRKKSRQIFDDKKTSSLYGQTFTAVF